MSLPPTLLPATLEDGESPLAHVAASPPTTVVYALDCLEGKDRSTTFTPMSDVSIGRDQSTCQLCYPECGVISRVHCKIFSMGRDVFVHDLSSNGTFVNGKLVGKGNRKAIRSGDIISVMNPQLPESSRYSWKFLPPPEDDAAPLGGDGKGVAPSSKLEGVYELGKVLGTGNFATVRLGKHRATGRQVAVKIIEKKRFALSQADFSFAGLQSEVEVLRKMQHKNIISLFDVFDEERTFTMVLELISNGDFFDYIVGRCHPTPFTEQEAKKLFLQLLEAMLYMHSKDVVHRDLKPENILVYVDSSFVIPHRSDDNQSNAKHIPVDKVTLKVTDFGLAKFCKEHDVMTTMCGTESYLAPEVKDKSAAGYSWSVDVWSLGVILYIMLSGSPPKDPQKGNLVFHSSMARLSPESKDLILNMLKLSVKERFDLADICAHPWLKGEVIPSAHLASHKDRLVLCPTMNPLAASPSTSANQQANTITPIAKLELSTTTGVATDGDESDDGKDGSPSKSKKRRTEPAPVDAANNGKITVWYWKRHLDRPDSDPTAWQTYSDEDCANIEKQRLRDAKSCKVGNTGDYRISFQGMFQYSVKDPSRQRPIKWALF